ncbi:MAG: serine protease, partial [Clostridia bacterium]|nr:serine protease [Clostridia bacterium]
MSVIPNFFHDAVVAIGQKSETGEPTWLASGFIVARKNEDDKYNIFMVSNRHVFESGLKQLVVRFNLEGVLTAIDYEVDLFDNNNVPNYSVHPNPNIDVACTIVSNAMDLARDIGRISAFKLGVHTLSRKEMLAQGVDEGSLVYSLGFPAGRVNSGSKMPICRLGCISRIKETIDDEGYLLDIQNFPGSSGSPIINKLETSCLQDSKHCNGTYLI